MTGDVRVMRSRHLSACRGFLLRGWHLLTIGIVIAFVQPSVGFAEDDLQSRFLEKAPKAWAELQQLAYQMKAVVTVTDRDQDPTGNEMREVVTTFRYNGKDGNLLADEVFLSGARAGRRVIRCSNPKYSFKAEGSSAISNFLVNEIAPQANIAGLDNHNGSSRVLDQSLRRAVELPLFVNYVPISAIVAGPTFRVTSATTVAVDGEQLDEIFFESEDVFNERLRFRKGRMLLDSNHFWAIRKLVCFCIVGRRPDMSEPPMRIAIVNEYSGDVNGFPAIRSHLAEMSNATELDYATSASSGVFASLQSEYKDFGPGDVTPNECLASAFEIPEPQVETVRKPWIMWFSVLVGMVVLAIVAIRTGKGR